MRLDEKARERAGISDSPISPAALRRAHRTKNLGVEFIDDEQPEAGPKGNGIFARAVGVRKARKTTPAGRVRKPSRKATAPDNVERRRPKADKPKAVVRKAKASVNRRPARKRWTIED